MIKRFRDFHIDMAQVIALKEEGVFILKGGTEIPLHSMPYQHLLHEWRESRSLLGMGPPCPEKPEGANDFDDGSWGGYE